MFAQTEYLQGRKAGKIDQLVGRNNPIFITINYKGIILTQLIRVLSILPERIIFEAPESIICFTLKERVHLYSCIDKEIISARVLKCNPVKGILELTDFTFTGLHWNERQFDRVQPQDPIYVTLKHKKALVRANLDNLSVGGMSLMVCKFNEEALPTDHEMPVLLTIQLPGDNTQLDIKGKVVHARQTGRLVVIGVQLIPNSAQENGINRYVVARKAEILAELEQTFREVCDHHWISTLYT